MVPTPNLSCSPEGELSFGIEGGQSLLSLALDGVPADADAAILWVQQFARVFMIRLCQVRDLDASAALDPALCQDFLSRLPPMPGAEYVTAETLARLWRSLVEDVRVRAGSDLELWLAHLGGEWRGVGRVTFHLAENKNDPQRPFAFLATYAEGLTSQGRLQHLPLARAMQQYAGAKDESALKSILAPVRAAAERSPWAKSMLESRKLFQALAWTPGEAYEMVRELDTLRQCGVVVKVPDWWRAGRPSRAVVQVVLEPEKAASTGVAAMLAFKINLALDGEELTAEELEKIRAAKSGLVTLRGSWVEMDRQRLDQVLEHWQCVQRMHEEAGLSFHQGMRYLSGFDGGSAAGEMSGVSLPERAAWSDVTAGAGLQEVLRQLRQPGAVEPPAGLQATLRTYQQRGYEWLWFMQKLGLGACLADDMGLGKTLQVIALLLKLKQAGAASPSLVVCPASLLGNWRAELRKFAPALAVKIIHGSVASESLGEKPDVVLTTYLMATREQAVRDTMWNVLVLDEAQAIKNPAAKQSLAIKSLRARARIALTGTPVENRPGDLWSLFDFLNPGLLGSAAAFQMRLKSMASSQGTDYGPLRRLIQPYLLRRMKTDKHIISDLPDKIEVREHCGLTRRQAVIYTRLVEELRRILNDKSVDDIQRRGQVLGFLNKFKQVCNHPSHYSGDGQYKPEDSGKFLRLAELAAEIAEKQERVLVFTQYQEMCEPLAAHLAGVFGREGLVLHGGTPVVERQRRVERFQQRDGPPFFVISVKAGGTGLTLTAATQVIHFDRWWNPAVENQATDRAYRIGQKRNVIVHKFVVAGTLEERVDRMLADKRLLADSLLADEAGTLPLTELGDEELLRLVALDIDTVM